MISCAGITHTYTRQMGSSHRSHIVTGLLTARSQGSALHAPFSFILLYSWGLCIRVHEYWLDSSSIALDHLHFLPWARLLPFTSSFLVVGRRLLHQQFPPEVGIAASREHGNTARPRSFSYRPAQPSSATLLYTSVGCPPRP